MRVLLTGGMGFIGSHTAVVLQEAGHEPVLYDNLSNADLGVAKRIAAITGKTPKFIEGDIRDEARLERALRDESIEAVIHFAGLKAVGESVVKPLEYYDNNLIGTIRLLEAMKKTGVRRLIFSSSSTVYGTPKRLPLHESDPTGEATNPYGRIKLQIEEILSGLCRAAPDWSAICLRYFNPIGAHPSGLIGEDPNGIPNNLLPYVARVANGRLPCLNVFGGDYETPDGTGVRDYIHVVDLARGHVKALDFMGGKVGTGKAIGLGSIEGPVAKDGTRSGVAIFNLGTGTGSSVLEVIKSFEQACGKELPYRIVERRPGDIAENYAACDKAATELGWVAEYDLARMCADAWNWQSQNPNGYNA